MIKQILRLVLVFFYGVEVRGLDNYKNAGKRVLIVSNHTSFLDPLLLGVFLPDKITFAINTYISERWWIKPFLLLSQVFPMDPTHPLSLKALINHLQNDTKTVIFPEGRLTVTGSLMKIYDGTGMVADKSGAAILPIRISGAEYTYFSRLKKIVRLQLFPKIIIDILPHTTIAVKQDIHGKTRRKYCGHILSDIMSEMVFETSNYRQSIFSSLLDAKTIYGGKHLIAEDVDRKKISYDTLLTRTIAIGGALRKITKEQENVGVFLPNSSKTLNVVLGLQLYGRVPAMLNYSTGSKGMLSACRTAHIKTVLTSKLFIELGKFREEADSLSEQVNLVYLEDLVFTKLDKLKSVLKRKTVHFWYKEINPDNAAVVLFTSGSEGEPKGVVLSHANILANHSQLQSRINFNAQDVVLNFLPMFHSFGFTVGTLLPTLNGMRTFFYPSPLHYSVIPEIAYDIGATIMFGTNTFLAAYAKKANPYDFYSMRYVVAGAEKLQNSTRELWSEKFGIRILEGYGATETTPVASVNTPMDYKSDTVGRLMTCMDYRLEDIPGITEGGKLHLYGPNIMKGYLLPNNTGELTQAESVYGKGWYDTGDIVDIDDEGFVKILGRSKRFAKIGGEMVSLTAVEGYVVSVWPEGAHAVTSLPDAQKGEQIVLLTTQKDATAKKLSAALTGVASINLPKKVFVVAAIPVLATGKVNYPTITALAESFLK